MMVIWVMCLLLAGATGIFALDDDINWAEAFENVTSHDPAKANLAREQITGQLLTKLCAEDPALAAADVRKITGQLNRPEVPIRMQASASLFVVSQCRSDSTEILVPAFTALRSHVHDTEKRIGVNSVNTLDSLTPGVPDEELAFLIELVNGQEDTLAIAATRGIVRMAISRSYAADTIDRLLSPTTPTSRRMATIQAISTEHTTDPRLISHLGRLLSDKNTEIVHKSLIAISELGTPAIAANLEEIEVLTASSKDDDTVALAKAMIERQKSEQ